MDEKLITDYYEKRGFTPEAARAAVAAVEAFEAWMAARGESFSDTGLDSLKTYLALLVSEGKNDDETLLGLGRYCYLAGRNDLYIYFTSILGISDILGNIAGHTEAVLGTEVRRRVFDGLKAPPAGSPPEAVPPVTRELVRRLQEALPETDCRRALTANAHGIPASAFDEEKKHFAEAPSLEAYLAGRHQRLVETLNEHAKTGKPWFEQTITGRVVDLVRNNQEIQAGVLEDGKIYVTKIPYDPDGWLAETDPERRRYLACHCPMARASLLSGDPVNPVWCYCSAGFEKLIFDTLFDRDVEVEVTETVLGGDHRCRFTVTVPL